MLRHLLLLLVVGACAKDTVPSTLPAPSTSPAKKYVPIIHMATEHRGLEEGLAARFAKAGVDAKILQVKDVPKDEVPAWADSQKGWIAFVNAAQRQKAEAVKEAWFESITVRKKEGRDVQSLPTLALGEGKPVAPETRASVQKELARRVRIDQAVRRDARRHGEMKRVDADNTAWLKAVALEHGWIDAERFGKKAADAAFLLVQHSGDIALMNAALPIIERDVRAGRLNAQTFALLFDRIHFMHGGLQRYGTQVTRDNQTGDWVVTRLEDPDRVDERRKAIGLGSLRKYLSGFGHPVRIKR